MGQLRGKVRSGVVAQRSSSEAEVEKPRSFPSCGRFYSNTSSSNCEFYESESQLNHFRNKLQCWNMLNASITQTSPLGQTGP